MTSQARKDRLAVGGIIVEDVPRTSKRVKEQAQALNDFIFTINVTGGAVRHANGNTGVAIDEGWTDLGAAYLRGCAALGLRPEVRDSETGLRNPHDNDEHDASCNGMSPCDMVSNPDNECPVSDPDCLSNADECHDACEPPGWY